MQVCTAVRALVQLHARNMVARSLTTGSASLSGRLITLSLPVRLPNPEHSYAALRLLEIGIN